MKLRRLRDALLTLVLLAAAGMLCLLLRQLGEGDGYAGLLFVLAVACVARWTEGYRWGILAAFGGVVLVNYVFTYPYWEFNFTMTGYPLTFLTLLAVAVMVSAMTTRVKRQERLHLETEKEAMRANLLRAMSHDIRTPLTSIVGNTAALLENGDGFSPEQERRLLEDVNADAQWLIRLVENLLSVTRVSGGETAIVKGEEAAEEVVASAVAKFQKRFPELPVSVSVPDELLLVPMDATLIEQVLCNLLENAALHARGATGALLSVRREGNAADFAVSDDGCGIPRERLATIFEAGLADGGKRAADRKKNMGIGLSVCITIVRAHGGTMTAQHRAEGGACFRFTLPLKEGTADEAQG